MASASAAPTKLLIVVAAALIDADGRVLLAQRPENKSHPLQWEFPGGKLEAGETPEAALIRELQEELGIDVTAECLAPLTFASAPSDPVHLLMPLFACRKWRGAPQPREAPGLKWVKPQTLLSVDLVPADRPLAAMVRDYLGPS
ncbi:MAG: (deoxy)nucleoside triphosphate pyrophosphohydrolase [Pseudomonadota bacterium]